ncbi:MAG: polynucleotide adenylyltransferase PcnB [Gammaproteobacteria bacterium CG_4_10_14_0_8_um_filter_38_16]|nr:MAG: polynucleotide adenylyltransferase PcnB [Gammaproteobacteria bacterium CG_4_10_14_0_8_um_filter_38_16]PJA02959.1 MAG: polynucleotide adenylyltransferase PcnB [Gammaproteobacteria bacterium CG_4_10_14_0_2_um_filter_38_22]PJB11449.1 MAG: polynucleotide adenylyltransferase PcnB [Gammaproteobacteria bacterium CG_4_9_14_3_um_filter_38_9]
MQWVRRPRYDHHQSTTSIIIARDCHAISRASISANALKVLYRLKEAGHAAYLVGGGVRDILLGRKPKDFDVATDAHPDVVRTLFRNSRIIGRRFRLVHVFFGEEVIEVSTFRANASEDTRAETEIHAETGMIRRDNTYGTIEEDAWRRDFTVNALYYNIADFSIVDYMQGMTDLKQKQIRIIGDPKQRYHEDPVRLLRAIRFAAKLNFQLESQTEIALKSLPQLLQHVPTSRLFDECLKLFFEGNAWITYQKLIHYDYLRTLFPELVHVTQANRNAIDEKLIQQALAATDARFKSGESVNPGFLFSVFLWPVLQMHLSKMKNKKNKFYMRLHQFIHDIIKRQTDAMMIPKRLQFTMQAIWVLQFQLTKRRPNRIMTIFNHRYFRAAFDFMALRVQSGEITSTDLDWWQEFQLLDTESQEKMIEQLRS